MMSSIEQIKAYLSSHDISHEFIDHSGKDAQRSENAEDILGVSLDQLVKVLVVKDKADYRVFIVRGDSRLDKDKIKQLGLKKYRFATADEVREVSGYEFGGIPALPNVANQPYIMVDKKVMERDWVIGSGGDKFTGLKIPTSVYTAIGYRVEDLTE